MKERPAVGIATDGAHSAKERLTRFRLSTSLQEKNSFPRLSETGRTI